MTNKATTIFPLPLSCLIPNHMPLLANALVATVTWIQFTGVVMTAVAAQFSCVLIVSKGIVISCIPSLFVHNYSSVFTSNWSSDSHLPCHDMVELFPSRALPAHIPGPPIAHEQYIDSDYTLFKQSSSSLASYNYLDPNFCPAL